MRSDLGVRRFITAWWRAAIHRAGPGHHQSARYLPCSAVLSLAVAFLVGGCDRTEDPPTSSSAPGIQQLDAMSVEQRRIFLKGFPGDWRVDTAMARGLAEPPAVLPVPEGATVINLPAPAAGDLPVGKAIANRRSHREFTDDPLGLDQLSFLLAMTQGVTDTERDGSGEITRQSRAVPSGGGRYPLETFLVIQHVEGLEAGLYRYLPSDHDLLLVRKNPDIGQSLQRACYDNATTGTAPVTFIWAAVPQRTEWKYGCISHKMIAMEAGHVCQNLYLATESIGAGTCAMLGYHQPTLDALIGVDGKEVFAVYLAPVGIPV